MAAASCSDALTRQNWESLHEVQVSNRNLFKSFIFLNASLFLTNSDGGLLLCTVVSLCRGFVLVHSESTRRSLRLSATYATLEPKRPRVDSLLTTDLSQTLEQKLFYYILCFVVVPRSKPSNEFYLQLQKTVLKHSSVVR